jgi:tetratricopeptide (TPR) repeat protein
VAGSYLAGLAAIDEGDLRLAANELETALQAAPDDVALQGQVFELLLASGELDRAVASAAALQAKGAASDEMKLVLALDAARRDRWQETVTLVEGMGSVNPAGPVRPILLAWARFGAGAHDTALAALAEPGAGSGLDRLRAYHRAVMLGLDGKPAEGLEALRITFPDLARTPARVLRGALALQLAAGDRAGAQQLVAAARAGEPEDAELADLAAAVERGDGGIGPIRDARSGMGDALLSISEAFFDQERNVEAIKLARAAGFAAPDDDETWLLAARIALAQENPTESLAILDHVPVDSPVAWSANLLRATALEDQERFDQAAALLEDMAKEQPKRPDSLVALGDLLRSRDRFAEAEHAYSRAIERLPAVGPGQWRLLYARGIAYERTDRWPQAEADLKKALELEPDQPFVLNYLGYSWVDQGLHLDEAKAMLHRAVELRPEDGFIVDSLGWAYYRLGENDKAVTYLERAVELQPGDPVLNDHLGDVYWRVGRTREARFQWQRALTFEPESDQVPLIQKKLANGLADAQPAPG